MLTPAQPVSRHSRAFTAGVVAISSAQASAWRVAPPSAAASAGSVAQRVPRPTTATGISSVPGGSAGSSPPASPKLTSAPAPSATRRSAAARAPAGVPPPIATGQGRGESKRASAARPTTNPTRAPQQSGGAAVIARRANLRSSSASQNPNATRRSLRSRSTR